MNLQKILNVIQCEAKNLLLVFNPKKTKIIKHQKCKIKPPIFIDKEIKFSKEVKYMGLLIDSRFTYSKATKILVEKWNAKSNQLRFLNPFLLRDKDKI